MVSRIYSYYSFLRLDDVIEIWQKKIKVPADIELTNEDWRVMREAAAMLEPFYTLTNFLQYKYRSVASAKVLFVTHLNSRIEALDNGEEVVFFGENGVSYKTRLTTELGLEMLQRL